jgi:L-lactate dehydrogenase complex protein LldG
MPINITPSKENIFKRIRKALSESTPLPFPQSDKAGNVFEPTRQELEVEFAEQFSKLQGKFIYCLNAQELASQLNNLAATLNWGKVHCRDHALKTVLKENLFENTSYGDLASCDVAITSCEFLVARTGSIVMSAAGDSGRTTSVYAPIHICIAYTNQLVYDIKDALVQLKEKYSGKMPSLITFASGPSRTADIEKTLVTGVHGPREVYCFLVETP